MPSSHGVVGCRGHDGGLEQVTGRRADLTSLRLRPEDGAAAAHCHWLVGMAIKPSHGGLCSVEQRQNVRK